MGLPYLTPITISPHLVKFLMYITKLSHKMSKLINALYSILAKVPSSDSDPAWGGAVLLKPLECLQPLNRP